MQRTAMGEGEGVVHQVDIRVVGAGVVLNTIRLVPTAVEVVISTTPVALVRTGVHVGVQVLGMDSTAPT